MMDALQLLGRPLSEATPAKNICKDGLANELWV